MNPRTQNFKKNKFIKEFKKFKRRHRHLIDLQEDNTNLSNVQQYTNIELNKMMKTVQDLKTKLSNETEILERTQAEMEMN